MITYTVDKGQYITMEESLKRHPEGKRGMYVNLTNRCTCACTFCLRSLKKMNTEMTLWLETEPTLEEAEKALDAAPWEYIKEVIFCGFGEPTMRLDDVVTLLRYVKKNHPDIATRINTNGLSDLNYHRDTAPDFDGHILDTVSISLNASNKERYLALTRSQFGIQSYEAMLDFAQQCKRYVPQVILTVVDHVENQEEIDKCRDICQQRGLNLRVRAYEGN
ncbi:radical SAM protein [Megasphaera cerevisiae DSM 20462]|jgi:TatD family-associated radical SAM protein|uniref:Radical SAM protein n=1 Tax=Megasphaera cerevisiae DSM 20462 TaxID=1122219 RepID=A0A0J6WY62_9FIRM|nr:TatD family nuclease-associated radical SAM protein [Megasphaera cerevisiae]KMO86802.1 radical SAM protein [Megasphaera cerevisiae DSM 20462]MCI1750715.1 TatD family nuclease-associated radical SAM protein [Megasphaera cerevisiae]OKY54497.1 radical SAM protein [Megasphaera cerevisiae]SJZ35643.1 radical SAM protein, TatD family-associated [Megasphaera cerevisiae DSM 20462]